jgi:hypothetical protein
MPEHGKTGNMDAREAKAMLGERGQLGSVLLVLGLLVVGRHDKKAGIGTTLVVVGMGLVAGGVVDSALEELGMKGML